ncbi:MAG: SPOR domain-containing protein [Gammaproteobacteria bacterium]|nr:SPOR domain-containing protein [Gammaproteobacteria bacterium]
MRAVLWLLLLANLGYLGWNVYQLKAVAPEPVTASSRGAVERLHLVEEGPGRDPATPAAPEKAPKATPGATPEAATAAGATPEPPAPAVVQDGTQPPSATATAGEEPPDGAPSAPLSAPPEAAAEADDESGEEPAPALVATRCVLLGPFPEEADTDAMVALLEEQGMTVETETRQDRRPNRYWIYLPQFADITAAREALDRLRDAGVTDFIRVMRGPNVNAVSLGLYSRENSARARMDELESKGFEPAMEVRYEQFDQTWLRITLAIDARLPRAELAALVPELSPARSCP